MLVFHNKIYQPSYSPKKKLFMKNLGSQKRYDSIGRSGDILNYTNRIKN